MNRMNTADELRTKTNFQNQELKERKIKRDNIKLYSINNDKQEEFDNHNISSDKKNENLVLLAEQNPYYIEFNRLLNSKKCVNIYVFIIILSLTIFIYSLVAYFKNLSTLPILIAEIILTVIVVVDMSIRIYVTGCLNYFKKCLNLIDIFLIMMSVVSIVFYLEMNNLTEKIEEFSFALLLFLRNFSQLLRLFVLLKNQKEVKQNIEEIIHFSSIFEEKKESMNSMKKPKGNYLEEISFVEEAQKEESKNNKKEKSVYDLEYKDSDGNEGRDKADN